MNLKNLRRLVLETVQEERTKKRLAKTIRKARLVLEDADPAKMDKTKFPQDLSQVAKNQDQAVELSSGGAPEKDGAKDASDDAIPYEDMPKIASVQDLKPSQSSMNIPKALAFALGHIKSGKPGGHLGAFVSSDNFIMDGHHRWISSGMVDPTSSLGGYKVAFPGEELVAVLNNLTVGRFGKLEGKPGGGGFDQFTDIEIKKQLEIYLKDGSGKGEFRLEPEDVQSLIEKFSGVQGAEAVDATVGKFVANLAKLTLKTPGWASIREEMPIIEKGDSQEARDALAKGEIDVNPPYADEKKEESFRSDGTVILERWQKLAGLLKD